MCVSVDHKMVLCLCYQKRTSVLKFPFVAYNSGIEKDLNQRSNISNTRKSVSSDIQTLRSGLKKRGAAEFFF